MLSNGTKVHESAAEWRQRLGPVGLAEVKAWRAQHSFSPHQLRHTAATTIRREYDIEQARIILGHSSAFTTEIYAKAESDAAKAVVGKIG